MIGTTFVTDLATQCRIGCNNAERNTPQPILIDISCQTEMAAAVASDSRRDCVDYCDLHRLALALATETSYKLLEKLAYEIARQALALPHVLSVTVGIRKPFKLAGCTAAGVSLTLTNDDANDSPDTRRPRPRQ